MSKKVVLTEEQKLKYLGIVINTAHQLDGADWMKFAAEVSKRLLEAGLPHFPAKYLEDKDGNTDKEGKTDRFRNLHMSLCILKKQIVETTNFKEDDLLWPTRPPATPEKSKTMAELLKTDPQAKKLLDLLKSVKMRNSLRQKAPIEKNVESINTSPAETESIASK